MRVRGKGVRRKDGTMGDLLVTVEVVVPTELTTEQRDALQAFADASGDRDLRGDLMTRAESGPATDS